MPKNIICMASGPSKTSASTLIPSDTRTTFQAFWKDFREIALKTPENIPNLARLPVVVHGVLDSDPQKLCDAENLRRIWPILLTQPVYIYHQTDVLIKSTLRNFLRKHLVLPAYMIKDAGDNRVRVGDFVFVKTDKRWHLAELYTEIESISCPAAK